MTPEPTSTPTPTPEPVETTIAETTEVTPTPVPETTSAVVATTVKTTDPNGSQPTENDSAVSSKGATRLRWMLIGFGAFVILGGFASGIIEEYRYRRQKTKISKDR
ncbi:MAG: hypothetical protein PHF65_05675 [Oscillospiraceae bacterium]|nr:hypothetical protein [Oscillospiraceae bacterium]